MSRIFYSLGYMTEKFLHIFYITDLHIVSYNYYQLMPRQLPRVVSFSDVVDRLRSQLSDPLLVCIDIVSKLYWCVQVGWRLDVRIIQHRDYTNQNWFHSKNRSPSLLRLLLRIHVVLTGWMQNRNTHVSVWVDVRVPHFCFEDHLRRIVGIVVWKFELCLEVAALVQCVLWSFEHDVPEEEIIVIFQSNRCRDVVSVLAVFQLFRKHLHSIVFVVWWTNALHVFK